MRKNNCGVTAADILKTAARQTDDIAKDFELDSAGKMIVYRYTVKLLIDGLNHGADIENADYMDSMGDWLDRQIELSDTANADNVTQACIVIHACTVFAQLK